MTKRRWPAMLVALALVSTGAFVFIAFSFATTGTIPASRVVLLAACVMATAWVMAFACCEYDDAPTICQSKAPYLQESGDEE